MYMVGINKVCSWTYSLSHVSVILFTSMKYRDYQQMSYRETELWRRREEVHIIFQGSTLEFDWMDWGKPQ